MEITIVFIFSENLLFFKKTIAFLHIMTFNIRKIILFTKFINILTKNRQKLKKITETKN